jgi:hypothetical protein
MHLAMDVIRNSSTDKVYIPLYIVQIYSTDN